LPTGFAAVQTPPGDGLTAPFMASQVLFRTAASPLRPGSLIILGNMEDGTAFNVTEGNDGKINAARVKGQSPYTIPATSLTHFYMLYCKNGQRPEICARRLAWLYPYSCHNLLGACRFCRSADNSPRYRRRGCRIYGEGHGPRRA
jgi:hypothetical protein